MNIEPNRLLIQQYDYPLPDEKIAVVPSAQRDASRLLIYKDGKITDEQFQNLSQQLYEHTNLVLNNSRVIEARILFQKQSGGQIEIFCLEPASGSMEVALNATNVTEWLCLIGGASKWKKGTHLEKRLQIGEENLLLQASFLRKEGEAFLIRFTWTGPEISFSKLLHHAGCVPLPPYIRRTVTEEDKERYQTVFSKEDGSVAAPTAGLHFTENILSALQKKNILPVYVTLHVGAGTFKPVKTETVADHHMHQEPFSITRHALEQLIMTEHIISVGTTSLRTLESLYWIGVKLMQQPDSIFSLEQWEAYELAKMNTGITMQQSFSFLINWMKENKNEQLNCKTGLIIVPGYEFKTAEALITNFHQPQSTLLLLVSAFIGEDWKKIYTHALENDYRFLSYGDSSLLWRSF